MSKLGALRGNGWSPALALALLVLTLLVYWPMRGHDFVFYDDPLHVTVNPFVLKGLTFDGAVWAFSSFHAGNWYPVTWLSHMLDVHLFGVWAGGHHLTSLLLHALNTLLLFLFFVRATHAPWRSGLVAALFALHPLHVESVAWVSARKDVLSTCFWLLTMLAYAGYVRRPGRWRYLSVVLCFVLGLLTKSMLVTLPLVLILLDYWPLARPISLRRSLLEKGPLLALAAAAGVVTVFAQRSGGALKPLTLYPLGVRVANALAAAGEYVARLFSPHDLAVYYPHPGAALPPWHVAAATVFLVASSVLAIRLTRRAPYLPSGWLWFLVTLAPVIGVVQVGDQAMADRYTYVPLIGLFVVLAWGAGDLAFRLRFGRAAAAVAGAVVVAALSVASRRQLEHWRDTVTLFRHAVAVTANNVVAQVNLGVGLNAAGASEEALVHFREALVIDPNDSDPYVNMGMIEFSRGDAPAAIRLYQRALRLNPLNAPAHYNLAAALREQGRTKEAIRHYGEAARLVPEDADAHNNLGALLAGAGRFREAFEHFSRALELNPGIADIRFNLGLVLEEMGNRTAASAQYREALRQNPDDGEARRRLAALEGGARAGQ